MEHSQLYGCADLGGRVMRNTTNINDILMYSAEVPKSEVKRVRHEFEPVSMIDLWLGIESNQSAIYDSKSSTKRMRKI